MGVINDAGGMCRVHSVEVSCVGKVWNDVLGVVRVWSKMARWNRVMV